MNLDCREPPFVRAERAAGDVTVPSFDNAAIAAGLDIPDVWNAPDWAKTAYGAAPADRVVEALRAVASSQTNREAVVVARVLGGWRAAQDFVLSLLAAQGGDRVGA